MAAIRAGGHGRPGIGGRAPYRTLIGPRQTRTADLPERVIDVELSIRGILRGFGVKIGLVRFKGKFKKPTLDAQTKKK